MNRNEFLACLPALPLAGKLFGTEQAEREHKKLEGFNVGESEYAYYRTQIRPWFIPQIFQNAVLIDAVDPNRLNIGKREYQTYAFHYNGTRKEDVYGCIIYNISNHFTVGRHFNSIDQHGNKIHLPEGVVHKLGRWPLPSDNHFLVFTKEAQENGIIEPANSTSYSSWSILFRGIFISDNQKLKDYGVPMPFPTEMTSILQGGRF